MLLQSRQIKLHLSSSLHRLQGHMHCLQTAGLSQSKIDPGLSASSCVQMARPAELGSTAVHNSIMPRATQLKAGSGKPVMCVTGEALCRSKATAMLAAPLPHRHQTAVSAG